MEIRLPAELETLVKRALDNAKYTPYREKQETLIPYIPKEEFKRDWILYESCTTREKLMFLKILKFAVDYIEIQEEYKGNGRPPVNIRDILYSLCVRIYSNYSSWRCGSELKICKSMGYIDKVYTRSTLNKYLQNPIVTQKLRELAMILADPLAPVEHHFSADATGIGQAYGNKRWVEVREQPKLWRTYRKLHIISGAKTNIIVACRITEGQKNDSPFLPEMLDEAKKRFNIREFSADAGYLSKKNVKAISKAGALPFIKPKKNVSVPSKGMLSPWGSMLRFHKENQDLFYRYYHQRSNVEATFGMIKRKWGGFCRAKTPISQENEILAKIVCHNAVILARGIIEFDLDVKFISSL